MDVGRYNQDKRNFLRLVALGVFFLSSSCTLKANIEDLEITQSKSTVIDTSGFYDWLGPRITFTNWHPYSTSNLYGSTVEVTGAVGSGPFLGSYNAVAYDKTHHLIYVLDDTGAIKKYDSDTGDLLGWIGGIARTPTGGTAGCTSATTVTPGWCTGGIPAPGTGDGLFPSTIYGGMALDEANEFLFVVYNARVSKINANTGVFVGSIGKTTASTGDCPASGVATTWCTGGTFTAGVVDGSFGAAPGGIVYYGGFLYVGADETRVSKINATSGLFFGSIGAVASSTGSCVVGYSPGWCTGGSFNTDIGRGGFDSFSRIQVAVSSTHLYTSVANRAYISKFNLGSGTFVGSIGAECLTTGGGCTAGSPPTSWATNSAFTWTMGGPSNNNFSFPLGLWVDEANDALYVADYAFGRIVKRQASSGNFIATIPLSGTPYDIDGNSTDNLVLATDKTKVVKINLATATITHSLGGIVTSSIFGQQGIPTTSPGVGGEDINDPQGLFFDTSSNNLYAGDSYGRIVRYTNSGLMTGWIGLIGTSPTSGESTCAGAAPATFTPGWCLGGTAGGGAPSSNGKTYYLKGLSAYGGFLYAADNGNFRVNKYNISTGQYLGSVGNVAAAAGTCTLTGLANGWCDGANRNGALGTAAPHSIVVDGPGDALYVVFLNSANVRKFVLSTGLEVGWIGYATANPTGGPGTCTTTLNAITPRWCTGGTSGAGPTVDDGFGTGSFRGGMALDSTSGILYVADRGRIAGFNSSTGAYLGSWGLVSGGSTGTCPASGYPTGLCTGASSIALNPVGFATPLITGLVKDGSYLYAVVKDSSAANKSTVIVKVQISGSNLSLVGWRGEVGVVPAGGGSSCTSAAVGQPTPGFCLGGAPLALPSSNNSAIRDGTEVTTDGNGYLYVFDKAYFRIVKVPTQ